MAKVPLALVPGLGPGRGPGPGPGPGPALGPVLDDAAIEALGESRTVVLDLVLGHEVAAAIRIDASARLAAGRLRPAGIGTDASVATRVRGDLITWVEPGDVALAPVLDLFERIRDELATRAYLGTRRIEAQLAVYLPGAGYARHTDLVARRSARRMTLIYYASAWEPGDGGELELWEPGDPQLGLRRVEPRADRLVVFRPHVEHRVRTVEAGLRIAVSGWLRAD